MENFSIQTILNDIANKFKKVKGHYNVEIYIKGREAPVVVRYITFLGAVNESQSTGVLRVAELDNSNYYNFNHNFNYNYIPIKNIDYVQVHKS